MTASVFVSTLMGSLNSWARDGLSMVKAIVVQRRNRTVIWIIVKWGRTGLLVAGGLVGKIFQVLLHEGAIFLRIFFRLRLLDSCPVAFGQTGELPCAGCASAWAIRSPCAVPIALASCPLV